MKVKNKLFYVITLLLSINIYSSDKYETTIIKLINCTPWRNLNAFISNPDKSLPYLSFIRLIPYHPADCTLININNDKYQSINIRICEFEIDMLKSPIVFKYTPNGNKRTETLRIFYKSNKQKLILLNETDEILQEDFGWQWLK